MTQHVRTSYRNHRRTTWGLAIAVVVAIAGVLVPLGAAKPPSSDIKKFDACLQYAGQPACSPDSNTQLPGGATVQLKLTVTNEGVSNQALGSLNLDVPTSSEISIDTAQAVILSKGNTVIPQSSTQIALRNLNLLPGASLNVTFWVKTLCGGTNLQWSIATKQSNNFLGTGNDFSLVNKSGLKTNIQACLELRFVDQPAKTVVGAPITDADYSNGGPVSVGLYSGGALLSSCPSSLNEVTVTPSAGLLGGDATRPLEGDPCIASFDDLSLAAPSTYTLSASGVGSLVPMSASFEIISGTNCVGQQECSIGPSQTNNTKSTGLATGGNFTFVAFDSLDLGGRIPAGCAGFKTVGADAIYIAEGRSALSGELFVTYGVKKSLIQKKYGNNSGQQFIPICAGAKRIELVGGRTHAVNCDAPYGPDELSQNGTGWWGKELDPTTGLFTGRLAKAKCDQDTGLFFGIMGSFQDYTNSNACRIIDPTTSPTVTEWTSDTTYRYFTSRWPSSSATPPAKSGDTSCPDTSATPAQFANIPWDGYKGG